MIKLSLVTPTRKRPEDLRNLLNSLVETTAGLHTIELILVIDDDDEETIADVEKLKEQYGQVNIRSFVVKRSDHFSKDYFNFGAKQAAGRWVMAINDDSVFVTKDWDDTVIRAMEKAANDVGDDILLGIINDGMERPVSMRRHPDMSCWPILSQEYIKLTGGILLEEIYTWGGDFWLGRVFTRVQGGSRKVFITDVYVEHNSHHSNPRREKQLPQPPSFMHFTKIEAAHPAQIDEYKARDKSGFINDYIKAKKK